MCGDTEGSTGAGGAILIIEDHDDSRQWIEVLIRSAGYRVISCATVLDALSCLQAGERVCLILLDLLLPDTSGFQFRAEQAGDPELSKIPTVVMTGIDSPARYEGNLRPAAYLTKPLDAGVVLTVVREHCRP